MSLVGRSIPHESARTHVSGESVFIDDIPPQRGELIVELFGSPVAHGRVRSLHLDEARRVPGVVGLFTARDIPGHRLFGPIVQDEHFLAEDETTFVGDPLVVIAAETRSAALRACKLIRADLDPLHALFTIDEAIAANSFLGGPRHIRTGDVTAALSRAEHQLSGELIIGGQEHFYLESQAAIAYPGEQDTMLVVSSTQHPTECQVLIAEILGIPFSQVTVQCQRMGGGFGGKETQGGPPAALAALAARLTRRPARIVLDRDTDMAITGKRHPFKAFYRVGFTGEGRITALELDLYSNGGCTTDLSPSILERAMLHADNAYYLPNARISGRICKTNLPSNTAFRGFGGPQGVACIENILEEIALTLGRDAWDVRQLNTYGSASGSNGNGADNLTTPYGQTVRNNVLPALLRQLRSDSDYDRRRQEIAEYNARSETELRGLAMTAVKFGISFTKATLNQANALVNVYTDGSVLVSTGATEMGQGVHTRIRQLVADDLGVPYAAVRIGATSTDKNNNTSPTAASCGTDLNGAAALDATGRIKARLAEFAANLLTDPARGVEPDAAHIRFAEGMVSDERVPGRTISFRDLVRKAYEERINLGERGFYKTPGVEFDREAGKGTPFFYFTNGAAVSEVLIDRFTGEMKVPRVDLLIDAGIPLNPGIDRGQIIGGFIQGMGWVTTEELRYDEAGRLLSHSPSTYKIPDISDVPEVFNVAIFDNPHSDVSLKRSKALGEPPLLLGLSVFFAVKNALAYVGGGLPRLALPATNEEILMEMERLRAGRPAEPRPARVALQRTKGT
jgi:xanthine dehydrogenase large subunit